METTKISNQFTFNKVLEETRKKIDIISFKKSNNTEYIEKSIHELKNIISEIRKNIEEMYSYIHQLRSNRNLEIANLTIINSIYLRLENKLKFLKLKI